MEPFLKLVAKDLYEKYGNDLSRVAIVFPNKRAGLFFNEYLAQHADKPVWAPDYITISELFHSLSSWEIADPIQLVCELYKVFVECTHSNESLDDFYFWGELLIADFDDVDKNLVDSKRLFGNLQALKDMEGIDFLTKEQEEAIQQFFSNFSLNKVTELKQRFISLWNVLGDIYEGFRLRLQAKGIAYEGMLYREASEHIEESELAYDTYVFVGFNVLNKVEQRLFRTLQKRGRALFYWDYDLTYLRTPNHEAAEFIRRDLQEFPSSLPSECFDNYAKPKEIHFVEAASENIQARYLSTWLRDNLTPKESETAVVLCDESLLQPVFHSLPGDVVKHVNITMGFPLVQTPVYGFVNNLVNLQVQGFNADTGRYNYQAVAAVLKHAYTQQLSAGTATLLAELTERNRFYPFPSELQADDVLTRIFTPCQGNLSLCVYLENILKTLAATFRQQDGNHRKTDFLHPLYEESLFKAYTAIGRFRLLLEEGELQLQPATFLRLLSRHLASLSIPFHGEPAIGLQVMGVLETRNLDFKHVAVLSLNEGNLPKAGGETSFIPYNLRKAFGMTLVEHKNAVYAYYFYRLMQRAESVSLLYNSTTTESSKGEKSRFMLQMDVEGTMHEIRKEFITAGQYPQSGETLTMEKTPEVMQRLIQRFDYDKERVLSPSALNTYLTCPLKFFFTYVAGLKEKEDVTVEIDSAMFGTIFHRAAELFYKDYAGTNRPVTKSDIEAVLKDRIRLEGYVDTAFKELFFKSKPDEKPEYNGLQLINSEVLTKYLRQLFERDASYAPFTINGTERWEEEAFSVQTADGPVKMRVGGIIDRMDTKDGTLRVVDYKTGGRPHIVGSIEALFTPSKDRASHVFQTFLYAAILTRKQALPVSPALFYIHQSSQEGYSPVISLGSGKDKKPVTDFTTYDEEFRERLQALLNEIFDEKLPFRQTEFKEACEYCELKDFCQS